ncbi:hypothetical protein PFNF135_02948 [Plasmodium falciparum NF135/5.C10]|uniref:Uncharacterized protein n=1 Tax=Plasmodium falciparum NF135/5.C10 TaxID=1036726 RepID=W4IG84_PLAFA|nr:hypothetical protein PFNF135_02948 [Plasmodium falciparum NF135/5.C10]
MYHSNKMKSNKTKTRHIHMIRKNFYELNCEQNDRRNRHINYTYYINMETTIFEMLLDNNIESFKNAGKLLFIILSGISPSTLYFKRILNLIHFFFHKGGKRFYHSNIHFDIILFLNNYMKSHSISCSIYIYNLLLCNNNYKDFENYKDIYIPKHLIASFMDHFYFVVKDFLLIIRKFLINYEQGNISNEINLEGDYEENVYDSIYGVTSNNNNNNEDNYEDNNEDNYDNNNNNMNFINDDNMYHHMNDINMNNFNNMSNPHDNDNDNPYSHNNYENFASNNSILYNNHYDDNTFNKFNKKGMKKIQNKNFDEKIMWFKETSEDMIKNFCNILFKNTFPKNFEKKLKYLISQCTRINRALHSIYLDIFILCNLKNVIKVLVLIDQLFCSLFPYFYFYELKLKILLFFIHKNDNQKESKKKIKKKKNNDKQVAKLMYPYVHNNKDYVDKDCVNEDYVDKDYVDEDYVDEDYVDKDYVDKDYVDKDYVNEDYIDKDYVNEDYVNEDYVDNNYVTHLLDHNLDITSNSAYDSSRYNRPVHHINNEDIDISSNIIKNNNKMNISNDSFINYSNEQVNDEFDCLYSSASNESIIPLLTEQVKNQKEEEEDDKNVYLDKFMNLYINCTEKIATSVPSISDLYDNKALKNLTYKMSNKRKIIDDQFILDYIKNSQNNNERNIHIEQDDKGIIIKRKDISIDNISVDEKKDDIIITKEKQHKKYYNQHVNDPLQNPEHNPLCRKNKKQKTNTSSYPSGVIPTINNIYENTYHDIKYNLKLIVNISKCLMFASYYDPIYIKLFYSYLLPCISFDKRIEIFLIYSYSSYKIFKPLIFLIYYNNNSPLYILNVFVKIFKRDNIIFQKFKYSYFNGIHLKNVPKKYFIFLLLLSPFFYDDKVECLLYIYNLFYNYDRDVINDQEKDINYKHIYQDVVLHNDEEYDEEKRNINIIIIKFIEIFKEKFNVDLYNYFDFYRIYFILFVSCVDMK